MRVGICKLRVEKCELGSASCELKCVSCELGSASCELQCASWDLRAYLHNYVTGFLPAVGHLPMLQLKCSPNAKASDNMQRLLSHS